MDIGKCSYCATAKTDKYFGEYTMRCYGCRERLLLTEPCKLMRKAYADRMRRWGIVPDWNIEPNCGCFKGCKRRKYQHANT